MKYLIINSHPYSKSFNYTLSREILSKLSQKHQATLIDLVEDGFNPVLSANDLNLWRFGKTDDKLTTKYIELVQNCDVLVFTFPVWWINIPAILKGFVDKVFLPNVAYHYDENHNMVPDFTGKKAIVINTMEVPRDVMNGYYNNPISNAFIKGTLNTCGIELLKHFELDTISSGGREQSTIKFNNVLSYFESL